MHLSLKLHHLVLLESLVSHSLDIAFLLIVYRAIESDIPLAHLCGQAADRVQLRSFLPLMLSNVRLCPGYPRMPSGARSPIVPFPDASGALRAPLVVVDSSKLRRRMLRMPRPVVCVVGLMVTKEEIMLLTAKYLYIRTTSVGNACINTLYLYTFR